MSYSTPSAPRVSLRGGLRLLIHYAVRATIYNLVISLLGAGALFAISLATGAETQTMAELAGRALKIASVLGPILVVSGGYLISILAMGLFHYRELPFYLNRGLGPGCLALASWIMAIVVAAILLGVRQIWL